MKHALPAVALATLFALPAVAQNLAVVNGKPIPSSRYKALAEQVERSGRPVDANTESQIKEELVMREIFAQEAERRGLKASPAYRSQAEMALQTVLIRELFADFQRKNPVTDADIKAEYDKFAGASAGQEFHTRHILVDSEAEALALIADIKKGAKFEDLARQRSKDPGSGANGGDLDWAAADAYVPEFSQAMVKLAKGEMTDTPVKSSFGWHIIRVDDIRQAHVPSLDELKPQIAQELQQRKLQAFQAGLRGKAKVE